MIVNGSTTNKATLTGLAPNTMYDIFVVARSANMVEGKMSNGIHITTGTWLFFNGFLLRRGDGGLMSKICYHTISINPGLYNEQNTVKSI